MPNPLGTKEGREALRRGYETTIRMATGDFWRYEPTQTTLSALDGLDIAEEAMRALDVLTYLWLRPYLSAHLAPSWDWPVAVRQTLQRCLRRWQAWKEAHHDR